MVVGAIDGSHIPMIAPSIDEYAYVIRKQYHSINMQAICDSNLIFQDVAATWPESHHDFCILQSSTVYDRFENDEFGDCWLLGDSGYPQKKWLITPLGNPATVEERRFNAGLYHRKTKCVIERCFGVLKMRWRIRTITKFRIRRFWLQKHEDFVKLIFARIPDISQISHIYERKFKANFTKKNISSLWTCKCKPTLKITNKFLFFTNIFLALKTSTNRKSEHERFTNNEYSYSYEEHSILPQNKNLSFLTYQISFFL